jgi:fibronectin type 3 domain-containing protein
MKTIHLILTIFFISILYGQENVEVNFPIKASPKGIYILISDQGIRPNAPIFNDVKEVSISRSINKGKPKMLGKLLPASNLEAFENAISKDALLDIAKLLKLQSKEEAFRYTLDHPALKDYGLLSVNLDLGVALGAYFLDNDISALKNGDNITYYITYLGNQKTEVYTNFIYGQKPEIQKPVLSDKTFSDSIIALEWKTDKRKSPDIFYANIYMQEGFPAPFKKAGTVIAYNDNKGDEVVIKWAQTVKKGYQYRFVVVPTTIAFLEGTPSDTATVFSLPNSFIDQPSNMTAKDTSYGVFLSWRNPQKLNAQNAWLIQRTATNSKAYQTLAILDVNQNSYIDGAALPSEVYYYRIRTITIDGDTLEPSSHCSGRHALVSISPDRVTNVSATEFRNGVKIVWDKPKFLDIAGYYVYKANTSSNNFELISPLLKDTTYIDTSFNYARSNYIYGVKIYTNSDMMGLLGTSNIFTPTNMIKPAAPTGAKYYVEAGRISITWDDIYLRDKAITGYNIYRKKGKATLLNTQYPKESGFELLSTTNSNSFEDYSFEEKEYSYAITSIDQFGNESGIGQLLIAETRKPSIAIPNNFSVRKTSKGIVIDWDVNVLNSGEQYIIYRRSETEKEANKLNTVSIDRKEYIDNTVKPNVVYYYAIESITKTGISERSQEKVIKN